jgi:hypothetical protein
MANRAFYSFAWSFGPALNTHFFDPITIDPPANVFAEVALTRVGKPEEEGPVFASIQLVKASSTSHGDEDFTTDDVIVLWREGLSLLQVALIGQNSNVAGRLILNFD